VDPSREQPGVRPRVQVRRINAREPVRPLRAFLESREVIRPPIAKGFGTSGKDFLIT
jgi:hypothetical protein